jgi:S1-C subfamily serine protease
MNKLHDQAAPNIARLESKKDSGTGGTAFKVCDDKGQCGWATANHTIDGASPGAMVLRTNDGKLHDFTVGAANRNQDVAVLLDKDNKAPTPERPGFKINTDPMKKGDPLVGVGYGVMLDHLMLTPGRVKDGNFTAPRGNRYVFNFPGQKGTLADNQSVLGQSGGPVIDEEARVRGSVSNGISGNSFYSSADSIADALKKAYEAKGKHR